MALTHDQLNDLNGIITNIVYKDVLSTTEHYCVMFFMNALSSWATEIGDSNWHIRLTISDVITQLACMGTSVYSYRLVCASEAQNAIKILQNYVK